MERMVVMVMKVIFGAGFKKGRGVDSRVKVEWTNCKKSGEGEKANPST